MPLLAIVQWKTAEIIAKGGGHPNIIRDSAYVTLAIFAGLTASVFVSKKDFSFMRSGLLMAGVAATMVVFLSLGFGFNLGIVFSVAMVLLAAGYILYQTSQVLAHYHTEQLRRGLARVVLVGRADVLVRDPDLHAHARVGARLLSPAACAAGA